MKRTNIYLTDRQITGLTKLSERSGLSVAELVRRAVDALLEREAGKEKRS
jgi:Arc/MetJ-type ribon-helix-helix transcriptional regulator